MIETTRREGILQLDTGSTVLVRPPGMHLSTEKDSKADIVVTKGQIHHVAAENLPRAGRAIVLDTYSGTAGLAGIPLEMVTATDAVLVLIIKVVETPIVLLTRLPLTCLLL